ncbi:uncharacterized protein LOC132747126 [Ruditapes philippinarum]|uniref:uncharacterized protein LOC132747126 n=1 Tax=Ruditapes philippinarum TaxID=129788 RepID=UPI00295B9CAF|nr:uncharacterized protein LOC132747126 [Ruditapes philippinarum]
MADEKVKRAKAKGQGRRRSRELEDLHMCASTGKFNLEKLSQLNENEEEDENNHKLSDLKISDNKNHHAKKPLTRRHTDSTSQIGAKTATPRGGSMTKAGSKSSLNGVHASSPSTQKKLIARSISHNK